MEWLDGPFIIPLDDDMTRLAVITISLGAVLIRFAHWPVLGWTFVVFGLVKLWLAYHLAIAPCTDEPMGYSERFKP